MDPVRSERPASEALTDAERDARIEQLLLTGLDHYFANDYDQAINVWTRALFLDRHHDRARAYIERARSAQAERQRESEALMHQGLDALTSGDVARARELVADALARGASRDLALGVLDRIERLGVLPAPPAPARPRRSWLQSRRHEGFRRSRNQHEGTKQFEGREGSGRIAGATILLILAALGAVAVGVWGVTLPDVSGWIFAREAERAVPAIAPAAEALPLPTASERYLSRSRSLFESGRLRDALRELDRVPIGDSGRAQADRLRADIQRELLAVAAGSRSTHEVP
jgi:tetratricopeptide (TPR) repeat protein